MDFQLLEDLETVGFLGGSCNPSRDIDLFTEKLYGGVSRCEAQAIALGTLPPPRSATGNPLPPVKFEHFDETLYLVDGNHRVEAARRQGLTHHRALVRVYIDDDVNNYEEFELFVRI